MKRLLAASLLTAGCMWFPGSIRPKETGKVLPQDEHDQPLPKAVYYTELGPDAIDVREYPQVQQRNYQIFRAVCGDCHALARAVNSPTQSRTYRRFHLARMSVHSRAQKGGASRPRTSRRCSTSSTTTPRRARSPASPPSTRRTPSSSAASTPTSSSTCST